ncbi:acyl-CoA thioesterase-2 [Rhodococcus sp. 27YEA15]|uniref:acyl-CoA thioesterase n=1 Tax=Rhodococcus sp. 27YEA15 TaxID=3156259 RepID=UPI003C799746
MVGKVGSNVAGVLSSFELSTSEPDVFHAPSIAGMPRMFGGQIVAQTLLAARRTVPAAADGQSLHTYFLRQGDAQRPVELVVTRLREGRTQTCRSISAVQGDRVLAVTNMLFTSGVSEEIGHRTSMPAAPDPLSLPTFGAWREHISSTDPDWLATDAIDVRVVPGTPGEETSLVWMRCKSTLPDDPGIHQAMLVYMSDITTLSGALVPHGVPIGHNSNGIRTWSGLSVDHTMWFHHSARADEWLLFVQHCPASASGRALIQVNVFTEDGRLPMSIAQQALFARQDNS